MDNTIKRFTAIRFPAPAVTVEDRPNVATVGYRADRVTFDSALREAMSHEPDASSTGPAPVRVDVDAEMPRIGRLNAEGPATVNDTRGFEGWYIHWQPMV